MTAPTASRWQPAIRTVPVHLPAFPMWSPESTTMEIPIVIPTPAPKRRGRHRKPYQWWRMR